MPGLTPTWQVAVVNGELRFYPWYMAYVRLWKNIQDLFSLGNRPQYSQIRVGQTFDQESFDPTTYTMCYNITKPWCDGETRAIRCDQPIQGRYVTVHFPPDRYESLTLCEVEVFEAKGEKNIILYFLKKVLYFYANRI